MKYWEEFKDPQTMKELIGHLHQEVDPSRTYRLMEFCGGHTHAFFEHGIPSLLPENIELIHGPGCPVCVLPSDRISALIDHCLANPNDIIYSFGDMLRVPDSKGRNLLSLKAQGTKIRVIYDPMEVLDFCVDEPLQRHIFWAVGFETTTPPTALLSIKAKKLKLQNLKIYNNHVLTPAAMEGILNDPQGPLELDGMIGPGHVATITGTEHFKRVASNYQLPIVVSGFLPVDLMQSLILLVQLINKKENSLINQYSRAVRDEGNLPAKKAMEQVFSKRANFSWRGLGSLKESGIEFTTDFKFLDAESLLDFSFGRDQDHPGCLCSEIVRGKKAPTECPLFAKSCTPDSPKGSCMVSGEGSCSAVFRYGEHGVSP